MNSPLRTPQEAQQWLDEQGISKAEIARRFNVTPSLVDAILRGIKPCKRGTSHNIAVYLGLKAGQAVATRQAQATHANTDAAEPAGMASQAPVPANRRPHAVSTEHATLLVVDDSPDKLTLMRHLLSSHYTVRTADNGAQALEMATATPRPDLILLDIRMPGMDGYEVCRKLKANAATSDIPVIFLTGMSGMDDELIGLEIGAVDYLTKPVHAAILRAKIKTHLTLKTQADLLRQKNHFLSTKMAQLGAEISAIQDVSGLFDTGNGQPPTPT